MAANPRRTRPLCLVVACFLGIAVSSSTPEARWAAPAKADLVTDVAVAFDEAQEPLAASAPAPDPVIAAPVAEEPPAPPAPAPDPEPEPCAEALSWVAGAGLHLPEGIGYRCPSTQFGHQGTACWNWGPCPGGGFIAINMDLLAGATPAYLHHVVAHEVCHILEFRRTGTTSEWAADACAAAHGAPA